MVKTRFLTTTALMAAVICILGPLSLPIGPVPVSLTNLAIFLTLYVLDTKRGTIAYLIYMLLGLAGLPVFSGFSGGAAKLFGPTGGYIIGFIPMALICGPVIERYYENKVKCILAMVVGTWVLYLFGTFWLARQAHMTFKEALGVGVLPFIVIDLCKMIAASFVGPMLKSRLKFLSRE